MNQHDRPFQMMLPMPMPWLSQGPSYHGNEVPARVRLAVEFLQNLTFKTMTRGMANDVSMQEIEGQSLEVEERQAQHAACQLLTDYFSGKLTPTQWEIFMAQTSRGVQPRLIECPQCRGHTTKKAKCDLCKGAGQIGHYEG